MYSKNLWLTKICTKCGERKSVMDFYKHKSHKDKHSSQCKQCILSVQKKFRHKNRKVYNARARAYHHKNKDRQRDGKLRLLYGLTLEQKRELYISQNGCCAICGYLIEFNDICVDHGHNTKKIRGLLCYKCNLAIGLFNNCPAIIINAKNYLQRV